MSDTPSLRNACVKCINVLRKNHITILNQSKKEQEQEQDQKGFNIQYQYYLSGSISHVLSPTAIDAIHAAQNVQERRNDALDEFWERNMSSTSPLDSVTFSGSLILNDNLPIATKSTKSNHDNNQPPNISVLQFKKSYIHSNIPCLIRGLDESDFAKVTSMWTIPVTKKTSSTTGNSSCIIASVDQNEINTKWFLKNIGPNTLVPVRKQPQHCKLSSIPILDEDGRAEECVTVEMTMNKWIQRTCGSDNDSHSKKNEMEGEVDASLYLKDWHLQQIIENPKAGEENVIEKKHQQEGMGLNSCKMKILPSYTRKEWLQNKTDVASAYISQHCQQRETESLYKVPDIFSPDLLNPFLLAYYKNCDYRFVYWGPNGSTTPLHSDVLHTFSWSYNIFGRKLWTFYPPRPKSRIMEGWDYNDDEGEDNCVDTNISDILPQKELPHRHYHRQQQKKYQIEESFEVIQNAGEAMFVPSTWKHSVINLSPVGTGEDKIKKVESFTSTNTKNKGSNRNNTLSINHNWITAVALDQMLRCIVVEIHAVEKEMKAWEIDLKNFSAKESILRGCLGLNVSMFVLMVLTNLVECMDSLGLLQFLNASVMCNRENKKVQSKQASQSIIGQGKEITDEDEWELWFDIICMIRVLSFIMDIDRHGIWKQSKNCCSDFEVDFKFRLEAVLEDENMASQTFEIINLLCDFCNVLINQTKS